jgi:iron complex transport system substrate-binding protein
MSCAHLLAILALHLPATASASACQSGAKAFPSSMSGKGKINYANLFSITYYGSYKVIEYSPTLSSYNAGWHPDASMKGKAIPPLVLYQCGTPKPSYSDPGIKQSGVRFFQIPIQKAALGWGGALPFFELLSVTEAIGLIDLSYISSPCSQLMESCTPGIHMKNSNANWSSTITSKMEVVFTDSFGTGWAGKEKDIPFQISLDPGSLQRAEWVRFVAAFFNEEDKADQIFSKIEVDYNALKAMAQKLRADSSTEWKGRKPKVAWITKNYDGTMKINNAHYKIDFVEDAGGEMVPLPAAEPANCTFSSNTDGSKGMTCKGEGKGLSSFKAFLAQADVIIDESFVSNYVLTSISDFTKTYKLADKEIPALARNPPSVFRLDGTKSDNVGAAKQIGSSWFEAMPSQPQQLLAGLMEAFWSDKFESTCGFKFLRRIAAGHGQTELGHDDCPYYKANGKHDCAGIHSHMHKVPTCSPPSPTPAPTPAPPPPTPSTPSTPSPSTETTSAAVRVGLSSAVGFFVTASVWSIA